MTDFVKYIKDRVSCPERVTEVHSNLIDTFVEGMNNGIYNLGISWKSMRIGNSWVEFNIYSTGLSTFDDNQLTRLVLLAHERCQRIVVAPCNFKLLKITISQRVPYEAGSWASQYHPTLEQALRMLAAPFRSQKTRFYEQETKFTAIFAIGATVGQLFKRKKK